MLLNKQQMSKSCSSHVINIKESQEKAQFHKTLVSLTAMAELNLCSEEFLTENSNTEFVLLAKKNCECGLN